MLKLLRVIFYFVLILVTPHIALADSTTVVLSFPSPGPSPQDLAWDGNYLWCVDDSTDSLYKLNKIDSTNNKKKEDRDEKVLSSAVFSHNLVLFAGY